MKFARGILFLLLVVYTTPAFFYPTEDNVTEATDDLMKAEPEPAEPDAEYINKEETIDDEDLVDTSDDHPDGSETDTEATEDHETGLSPDSIDAEETATEVPEESPENNELSEVEEREDHQLKAESANETSETTHSGRGRKARPTRVGGRSARKKPSRRKPSRKRTAAHKRKHSAHRRRPHKGRRTHRRPFSRRRGPSRKPVSKGRSSEVEQTNKLIDMILANFSATIRQKSFQEEIRISAVPDDIKILPWAYRTISITEEAVLRAANHVEDAEAEPSNSTDTCTDTSGTNSTCTVTTDATNEVNLDDNEELGPGDHTEEAEVNEEKKPNGSEREAEKEGSELETDDEDDHIYTKDPYPALKGNDTVEYYVQLLHPKHGNLLDEQQAANETTNHSGSDKLKVEDDDLNQVEPAAEEQEVDGRKKRWAGKRNSKKPDLFSAVVTGLERIKRSRDVKTVGRNSSKVHKIHLSIGPLTVRFKQPVSSAFCNRVTVTTEELPALIVIKEKGGRFVASRFASKHATPYLVQVTLLRSPEDQAPDKLDTGRLVTHLSQELARLWNRALLLSKVDREFRDLFIKKKKPEKKPRN